MEKIKTVLISFFIFEVFDTLLTFLGISQYGIVYEKNIFIAGLIETYGFFAVSMIKLGLASATAFAVYALSEQRKKYMICISLLLLAIAVYGVGSNLYILMQ